MNVTGFVLYLHQQRDDARARGDLRRGSPLADRHAIARGRLLLDVLHWDDDGRPIQHRLAREFWG